MAVRQRLGDRGSEDARRAILATGTELRTARVALGLSLNDAARAAGMSRPQLARLERGLIRRPTVDQLARASRALGLRISLRLFPDGSPVRDAGQLALLDRFERLLGSSLTLRREVALPIQGDLRAWDGRVTDGVVGAFVEAEAHLGDTQATARRIQLKQRDDPRDGPVILVLARTPHHRRLLDEHREALRAQFPLDGPAIARALRAGRLPPASGILVI